VIFIIPLSTFHGIPATGGKALNVANFEIHLTGVDGGSLGGTFEQAAERLRTIERLDLEPDGYFVWMIDGKQGWRVTGMLYDDGRSLQYAHLQGCCRQQDFHQLVQQIAPAEAVSRVTRLPEGRLQNLHDFQSQHWLE